MCLVGKRRRPEGADSGLGAAWGQRQLGPSQFQPLLGVVCVKDASNIKVLDPAEAGQFLNVPQCHLSIRHRLPRSDPCATPLGAAADELAASVELALHMQGLAVERCVSRVLYNRRVVERVL